MSMSHSPRPWVIERGPHGDPDVPDAEFLIAEKESYGEVVATVVGPCRSGNPGANARLIAAASEILSALRELIRAWDERPLPISPRMQTALADADLAIAKAEGRP